MQLPYKHIKMKTYVVLVLIDVTYAVECIVIHQVFIPTKNSSAARILNTTVLGVHISLGKKAILHIISPECI
uniref:Putative secreted protein n=1 Tax=Panstrongylus lignarius TaxID=156445 RepID=A0A224Y6G5_9HEMI